MNIRMARHAAACIYMCSGGSHTVDELACMACCLLLYLTKKGNMLCMYILIYILISVSNLEYYVVSHS